MQRFKTLLLREWMQHHRGWLILMLVPPALLLLVVLASPFIGGGLHMDLDVDSPKMTLAGMRQGLPLPMMVGATLVVTGLVVGITMIAMTFQLAGLARRDVQDRSIEFWRSLPSSDWSSVAATVVMNAFAIPLLALGVGFLCSQVVGLAMVAVAFGPGAWFSLPAGGMVLASLAAVPRAALGLVMASLWLMPFFLMLMAASAWLKRWGVPVLLLGLSGAHAFLAKAYGNHWIGQTLSDLQQNAFKSILFNPRSAETLVVTAKNDPVGAPDFLLSEAPAWLLRDGLGALGNLGQPLFLLALAISAACFGLLVLRRRRSA